MRFLKGCKTFFFLCMLCAAISALADMIAPQIVRITVDQIILGESADLLYPAIPRALEALGGVEKLRERLWIMALAVVAVALVKCAAQYGFRVCNAKGCETLVKTMRDTLFRHIERLPFQWHVQNHTGDIIQRCTSDIETTRNFISEQMTQLLRTCQRHDEFFRCSTARCLRSTVPFGLVQRVGEVSFSRFSIVSMASVGP